MKKIKFVLPILAALLFLNTGMRAEAAKLDLEAGTTKTTATIEVKDVQSLEAELLIESEPKANMLTAHDIKATSTGGAMCVVSGNRVFVVGAGDPVTVTIQVDLEFQMDGSYVLALDGGVTDKNGVYTDYAANSKKSIETPTVTVGKATSNSSGGQTSAGTTTDSEKKDDEVDYEALKNALNSVQNALNNDAQLKAMQELVNKTNNALSMLSSDDQKKVDDAALDLEQSLAELTTEIDFDAEPDPVVEEELPEVEETGKKKSDGKLLGNFLKFAKIFFPIFAVVVFVLAALFFWLRSKKKKKNYDGAPMVEFNIEDDDE